jgi:hypothetical protein
MTWPPTREEVSGFVQLLNAAIPEETDRRLFFAAMGWMLADQFAHESGPAAAREQLRTFVDLLTDTVEDMLDPKRSARGVH